MIGQPICSELDYRNAGRNEAIRRSLIENARGHKRQYLRAGLLMFFTSFAQLAFIFWLVRFSGGPSMSVVLLIFSLTAFLNFFCCGLMIVERRQWDTQLKMMVMMDGLASKLGESSATALPSVEPALSVSSSC